MRLLAAAALFCFAALTVGVSQAFAAGWTPAEAVQTESGAPSGSAGNQDVAINQDGAQAVAWDEQQCSFDSCTCNGGKATTRVPGGAWAAAAATGCSTQVVVGPNGQAFAVWDVQTSPGVYVLYISSATAGQSFGAGVAVDTASATHLSVAVGVDQNGVPTVAWLKPNAGNFDIKAKTRQADLSWSGATQAVYTNATNSSLTVIRLALGPTGDAVIAWNDQFVSGSTYKGLTALFRAANTTTWGGSSLVLSSPTVSPTAPEVVFDRQNRATVSEAISYNGAFEFDAWTRSAGAGGTWSAKQVVTGSTGGTGHSLGNIALDSTGNAQAAFQYSTGGGYNVRVARRAAGSTSWTGDGALLPSGAAVNIGAPSVSFDSLDTATVAFSADGTSYMFRRAPGSTSYDPFTPPAGSSSPTLVTDANRYTIATWTIGGVTYTSVYDPVAPTIDTLDVPGSAAPGQAVSFVLGASDAWGPATYSVDFGDGTAPATGRVMASPRGFVARATTGGTLAHTYAGAGLYTATISVTDSAANTTTATRAVNVASPAVVPPGGQSPPPSGLPAPVLGASINVFVVKAPVSVKLPGTRRFRPLTDPEHLPNGTVIDTRKGRVLVVIADGTGGTDQSDFYEGVFEVNQPKALKGLANIFLDGGGFKGCPKAPRNPHAQVSATRKSPRRSVRHLWAKGSGKFRTVGRFSSATVRGTTWLTDDRCDGTLVRVKQGKVAVRDFLRRKTVLVRAPKAYFARAKR